MEIFGIGPLEFLLIVVIMLVVLGPKEMVATAGKIGRFIRQVVRSPMWGTIMQTSKDVRDLPTKIIREAGLETEIAQLKEVAKTPGQMMSEAAKQLTVEIDPIQFPKIPNPLAPSLDSANSTPAPVSPSSTPLPTSVAPPTPLAIDPITPESIASPTVVSYSGNPELPTSLPGDFTQATPLTFSDEIEPPQVSEPSSLSSGLQEEPAAPLIIDNFEPPSNTKPVVEIPPLPKRRTRRPKTESSSSAQDQTVNPDGDLAAQSLLPPPIPGNQIEVIPQPVRPKRSRVKPVPLESESLSLVDTVTQHENGGSPKSG
jgi:sec-independent protein translocase protein TatB